MLLSLQFSSLGKEHVGTGAAGSGVAAHYCRLGVFLSVDFSLGKSIVATESFTIIFLLTFVQRMESLQQIRGTSILEFIKFNSYLESHTCLFLFC